MSLPSFKVETCRHLFNYATFPTAVVEKILKWRYFLAVLWFLAFIIHDCLRSSLSITIVCMVTHQQQGNTSVQYDASRAGNMSLVLDKQDTQSCFSRAEEAVEDVIADFTWSKQTQGLLLGAVFWGYMIFQIPSGWLAERYGAQRVTLIVFTIASISTLCTPPAAYAHPYLMLGVRMVTGMGLAALFPLLPVFWRNWAPPKEWNTLLGFSLSGGLLGNAIIFPFGGFMCKYGFAGGWSSLYYVLGGIGLVWCLTWGLLVRDHPADTHWVGEKEKMYLERTIKQRNPKLRGEPTPWRKMMLSRPVIGLIITHCGVNYGIYMLITQLPTYMKEVLHFNIGSNGLYSMLPYLLFFMMVILTGAVTDCLIHRIHLSVGVARKIMNTLGCVLPGICLLVLALVDCVPEVAAITLLCGAVGFVGFAFGGYLLNYADISVQFAGTLSGVGNCISTIPGIVAPYLVAALTVNGTRQEWQTAFFIGVGSFSLATVVFLVFGSGEPQPWTRHQLTVESDETVTLETKGKQGLVRSEIIPETNGIHVSISEPDSSERRGKSVTPYAVVDIRS